MKEPLVDDVQLEVLDSQWLSNAYDTDSGRNVGGAGIYLEWHDLVVSVEVGTHNDNKQRPQTRTNKSTKSNSATLH
jgi:hypothetical protein